VSVYVTMFEGDDEKLLAVRLLRGYIELLGSHISAVLRSDVHLRRVSSALTHVLQFDCSLVQIIEERTAGLYFCCAMLCISAAYDVVECPSVCLSGCLSRLTFVYSVKMNKVIFKNFSPSVSHTILAFPVPNFVAVFRWGPLNEGIECRLGRRKLQFSTNMWLSDR